MSKPIHASGKLLLILLILQSLVNRSEEIDKIKINMCVINNCLFQCPSWDEDCSQSLQKYKECYLGKTGVKECAEAKEVEQVQDNYPTKLKLTCLDLCDVKSESIFFNYYIKKCLNGCIADGVNHQDIRKSISTVAEHLSCKQEKCKLANPSKYAREQEAYDKCMSSPICSVNQQKLEELEPDNQLNFGYFACLNSCLPKQGTVPQPWFEYLNCNAICCINTMKGQGQEQDQESKKGGKGNEL